MRRRLGPPGASPVDGEHVGRARARRRALGRWSVALSSVLPAFGAGFTAALATDLAAAIALAPVARADDDDPRAKYLAGPDEVRATILKRLEGKPAQVGTLLGPVLRDRAARAAAAQAVAWLLDSAAVPGAKEGPILLDQEILLRARDDGPFVDDVRARLSLVGAGPLGPRRGGPPPPRRPEGAARAAGRRGVVPALRRDRARGPLAGRGLGGPARPSCPTSPRTRSSSCSRAASRTPRPPRSTSPSTRSSPSSSGCATSPPARTARTR